MDRDPARALRLLTGTWEGSGRGQYPTIDPFEYSELVHFEFDERYPLIHYEQRTILGNGEPGHWESGFIRWSEDGLVEISSAQDGGRVEVLRGPLEEIEGGFRLALESVALGHDERLLLTRRSYLLKNEHLVYEMGMSTTTTAEPQFGNHLRAELERREEGATP